MRRAERPLLGLPRLLLAGFTVALALQIFTHQRSDRQSSITYKPLTKPNSDETYRGVSMGSDKLLSYLLSIRLQLHDNQAGRHMRYSLIDYDLLIEWLEVIQQINPASEYPMLLASRNYSHTSDKQQLRKILKHIDRIFTADPQIFWRNQAEATVVAKHRLGDLKLALKMAENLSSQPETILMPHWARDMHFLLLADLNEYETSLVIIRALLKSDSIKDPDEKRFLQEKLLYFQQKLSEYEQNGR